MTMPNPEAEEPDFDKEDEQAMDSYWSRVHRGESPESIADDDDDVDDPLEPDSEFEREIQKADRGEF